MCRFMWKNKKEELGSVWLCVCMRMQHRTSITFLAFLSTVSPRGIILGTLAGTFIGGVLGGYDKILNYFK